MTLATLERTRTQHSNQVAWETIAQRFFSKQSLDLQGLSEIQRIFLTTDGTLTDILEVYLLEPIQIYKILETPISVAGENLLEIDEDTDAMERQVLLQGQQSSKSWLYAESIIVSERIQRQFDRGLKQSNKPIGKLWTEYKVETFKETLYCFQEPAGNIASHFNIAPTDSLICRTYRVFTQSQPVMLITEKFPRSFYC